MAIEAIKIEIGAAAIYLHKGCTDMLRVIAHSSSWSLGACWALWAAQPLGASHPVSLSVDDRHPPHGEVLSVDWALNSPRLLSHKRSWQLEDGGSRAEICASINTDREEEVHPHQLRREGLYAPNLKIVVGIKDDHIRMCFFEEDLPPFELIPETQAQLVLSAEATSAGGKEEAFMSYLIRER